MHVRFGRLGVPFKKSGVVCVCIGICCVQYYKSELLMFCVFCLANRCGDGRCVLKRVIVPSRQLMVFGVIGPTRTGEHEANNLLGKTRLLNIT